MRNLLISIVLIMVLTYGSKSQVITITFLGRDITSSDLIPLDGVFIKNTTLNCDTIIYGETPIIVLTSSLGVEDQSEELLEGFFIVGSSPNPFNGETSLKIQVFKEGNYSFSLINLNGITIANYNNHFNTGLHVLKIRSSSFGIQVIDISNGSYHKSLKLVNIGTRMIENCIEHFEFENNLAMTFNKIAGFSFQIGNQLMFKSIKTGYYEEMIIETPLQNAVYTFNLVKLPVIPTIITASVTDVQLYSAISGGEITDDGGAPITERGVCWDTLPDPTLEDQFTSDGPGIGIFISELTELSPNTDYYVRAYATNSAGTAYGNQEGFKTPEPPEPCGNAFTINHTVTGGVAPVDKTTIYNTIDNVPGEPDKCWITSNLGSDHKPTTVNDITEESAGWYWQFNKKQGYKHDGVIRTPNTIWITSNTGNSDWQSNQDPCSLELGVNWRIPTVSEYSNVDEAEYWEDWYGPWNSKLKMHAAGHLESSNGSLDARGADGNYWTSSNSSSSMAYYFGFDYVTSTMYTHYKTFAFALRCVRD